jgi:large subunit ribosomal protein L15
MKLHTLKPAKGATHKEKRIGRGEASGKGGTSTKGNKGGQSRAGYKSKMGFEGGQMPLQRRLPKFGFKNINRIEYNGINLDSIQKLVDSTKATEINFDLLVKSGLAGKNDLIKIMGRGELTAKVEIKAHAFTASAKKAIEDKGGNATEIK